MPKRSNQPITPIIQRPPGTQRSKKRPFLATETKAQQEKKKRKNTIIAVTAIVAVIAIVTSVFYYIIYVVPFQRIFINVDNDSVNASYFLKRLLIGYHSSASTSANGTGSVDIMGTLLSLTQELVIKQEAPKLVTEVTTADIDQEMRNTAKGTSDSITDAEFKEWYRQQLNASQLSDSQFKELVQRSILTQRLHDYLSAQVPAVADQVHIIYFLLNTSDEAVAAKARIDNGEDFTIIARELSGDIQDMGWVPPKTLEQGWESVVDGLEVGKCSDPFPVTEPGSNSTDPSAQNPPYVLLMISEKASAMAVTSDQLAILQGRALQEWLDTQMVTKKITFHGLNKNRGFDSQTEAWLNYQLQRMIKVTAQTTATTTPAQ